MKKLMAILSLACGAVTAQPTIPNGNNVPSPGYSAPISAAAASNIGTAGANQTWNFSALSFTSLGTLNIISPSSSTMSSSFPTANHAYTFAGTTSFFNVNASKMEAQAYSITSPGSGNDMSPNPRTVLQFPFNFNDVITDTWQKVGGAINTVTLTYDGHGTLIMPSITYSNVVRVKESYANGDDYQWYTLNPLISVLVFDHNTNTMYFTGATPTGLKTNTAISTDVKVFPNPASDKLFMTHSNPQITNTTFCLHNLLGDKIYSVAIPAGGAQINIAGYPEGSYFYTITSEDGLIKSGKIFKTN
jgi:hypothetical protein